MVGSDVLAQVLVFGKLGKEDGCILADHVCLLLDNVDQIKDHRFELWCTLREGPKESVGARAGVHEHGPVFFSVVL